MPYQGNVAFPKQEESIKAVEKVIGVADMEQNRAGRSRFVRVCVFCGSSAGKRDCYQDAAVALGRELVTQFQGPSLASSSSSSSLIVSSSGEPIIPRTLMRKEVSTCITGETIGEVRPVGSMHQRKAEMARYSDAFIALPGGYGTLEELLEVITWAQLGIHKKPVSVTHLLVCVLLRHQKVAETKKQWLLLAWQVGLLNVDGYYDFLLAFIDKAVNDGFIQPLQRHLVVSASNARDLVEKLEVMAA
ncbi:hypothetical protein B296_00044669 [Ensete ventricosum]|uniref:Cytokinin riboside 5'-monophosphate phosphoribohydrolase n=1 Tax=Ensete ventricosum TaxID=4639 RepID=A0A426ZA46_ENSVE|nr:hypothetical protein B296_00044669 [Ensete ventricosum]